MKLLGWGFSRQHLAQWEELLYQSLARMLVWWATQRADRAYVKYTKCQREYHARWGGRLDMLGQRKLTLRAHQWFYAEQWLAYRLGYDTRHMFPSASGAHLLRRRRSIGLVAVAA